MLVKREKKAKLIKYFFKVWTILNKKKFVRINSRTKNRFENYRAKKNSSKMTEDKKKFCIDDIFKEVGEIGNYNFN